MWVLGMTNAELIDELRGHILSVPLTLLHDAADALAVAICHAHNAASSLSPLQNKLAQAKKTAGR